MLRKEIQEVHGMGLLLRGVEISVHARTHTLEEDKTKYGDSNSVIFFNG